MHEVKVFRYRKKDKTALLHLEANDSVDAIFRLEKIVNNFKDWEAA